MRNRRTERVSLDARLNDVLLCCSILDVLSPSIVIDAFLVHVVLQNFDYSLQLKTWRKLNAIFRRFIDKFDNDMLSYTEVYISDMRSPLM